MPNIWVLVCPECGHPLDTEVTGWLKQASWFCQGCGQRDVQPAMSPIKGITYALASDLAAKPGGKPA